MNLMLRLLEGIAYHADEGGGAGAGGASATSAAPASAAPAPAPSSAPAEGGGSQQQTDVEGFPDIPDGDLDEANDTFVGAAPTVLDGGSQGAGSAPAPVQAAAPTPAPAAAVQPAPAQPEAQPAPTQAVQSDAEELTPEQLYSGLEQHGEAFIDKWAQELFTLTPEEADALTTNPEQVLPRMMAKTLLQAARMIPHQMMQFVPGIVRQQTEKVAASSAAANAFYKAWPGIDQKHEAQVTGIAKAYMAANKSATREQAIAAIGTIACQLLGIDPATARAQTNGAAATAAPASAAAPAAVQAFVPAGAAVQGAPAGAGASGNEDPWSGFDLPNAD